MISCRASTERSLVRILISAVVILWLGGNAHAQQAEAKELFELGRELMADGKVDEACPKFAASYELDPGLGTLLNLANCHEEQGKTATAWAEWGRAYDRARAAGDDARAKLAHKHVEALEPRVPKVIVTVTGTADGVSVWRDDVELAPAMYGVALPVDPGTTTITIKRGTDVLEERQVKVEEGKVSTVTLDLSPHRAPAAPEPTGPALVPPPPPTVAPVPGPTPAPEAPPELPRQWQKSLAGFLFGLGTHAIIQGAVFYAIADDKLETAETRGCTGKVDDVFFCSDDALEEIDEAETFAAVVQAHWIGGGVILIAGAVLLATAPWGEPSGEIAVIPIVGPDHTGFVLGGAF